MTAEEKLTSLLDTMLEGRVPLSTVEEVARWMLARERAAVRRARGKKLGYAEMNLDRRVIYYQTLGYRRRAFHNTLVVAVPKRKKGAKR